MDDLRQRDLSKKPESELTLEERRELKRRFEEFIGMVRKKGGLETAPEEAPKPKEVRRWRPSRTGRQQD